MLLYLPFIEGLSFKENKRNIPDMIDCFRKQTILGLKIWGSC